MEQRPIPEDALAKPGLGTAQIHEIEREKVQNRLSIWPSGRVNV